MKHRFQSRLTVIFGCLFGGALLGCNRGDLPDMVPISGSVTYQDRLLDHGTVIFIPAQAGGRQASGQIQPNGRYELTTLQKGDGVQKGEYKIVVHSLEAHPGEPTRIEYEQSAQAGIERKQQVPQKYTSPSTTPLAVTVDADHSGKQDIELED